MTILIDLMITAELDTPVIGTLSPLDAPLSYAAYQRAVGAGQAPPQMTDEYVVDFPLPLAKWHLHGAWGWCTSDPIAEAAFETTVESRRRPATAEMARFSTAREHHSALGPMKARNAMLEATYYPQVTWHVGVEDRKQAQELMELLGDVTNLGGRHRNNHGHVTKWYMDTGVPNGWTRRPLPNPNGVRMMRPRAPYHHPSERVPHA